MANNGFLGKIFKFFKSKLLDFIVDYYGGNFVEYALLLGFGLFIFFIIVGLVTSLLDWTLDLSSDFFNLFGNFGN